MNGLDDAERAEVLYDVYAANVYQNGNGEDEQIVYVDFNLEKSGKVREKRPYAQLRRKEFYV